MSIKSRFIIFFLLFALPFLAKAQGTCTFSIKTTVTAVDCRANGVIAISVEGADLAGMQDFMFRAYPKGDNPDDYNFITNNIISGLSEGEYIVEAKAFCRINGVNISQRQTNVNVPRTVAYVEPDFTVNPALGRKTLSCLPTGAIYLQGIVVGKGPYTLKFLSYPASYTGDPIILKDAAKLSSTYQIQNVPAGTYEIELSDGCGSAIKRTATVENLSSNYLSTLIAGTYYATPNAKDGNCSLMTFYKQNPASSSDWYYYAVNASQFYEYAIYYQGQNFNDLVWNSFSNGNAYIEINAAHSLSDMREDNKTTAKLKIPQIYVRVKGGNCDPFIYKPTFTNASITTSLTTIGCGVQRLNFGVGVTSVTNNTTGIICYPYKWKIVEENVSTGAKKTTLSASPEYKYSGARDNLIMNPGYKYTITATDSQEYEMTYTYTGPTQITPTVSISSSSKTSCNDSIVFYLSGSSLKGSTIDISAGNNLTGAALQLPPHTRIIVPKTYAGSIYPYSADYTKSSYISSAKIPTGHIVSFLVTDTCGATKTVTYTGPSTYYYERNPNLNISLSCGRATITAPDLSQIYKTLNTRTGVVTSGTTVYMKIMSGPAGSDIIYSRSAGFFQSNSATDNVQVSKSGIYRFRVSSSNSFPSNSCYIDFDVNIQIPEMSIDDAKSAAYRCPGSSVGTGYIDLRVQNGSGNYKFTLYSQNNQSTPLATNTTGIFTSWPVASSDYYTIKIEDLICGRSMTHSVFVYDLGNATLGWPENNIFIKCLGDRIKLYSLALGDTSYSWTGPGGWSSTDRNPEIPVTTLSNSGEYRITVQVPGCGPSATVSYAFTLSIADKVMYWNPDAVDNNWYNTANWLTSNSEQAMAVPAACTTVHIAGNSTKYPNLDMAFTPRNQYGFPVCDTIIFHYGSETINPHFLKYNRAKVQYNFNFYQTYALDSQPAQSKDFAEYPDAAWGEDIPAIKRARWYTISAPLKHITGGDFGLGGYPDFYQRLYNATDPQRGSAAKDSYTLSFNTQNIDLKTTGHAMALWVPDYDPAYPGSKNHKHLQALKGIMEMPYFLNPQIMANRPLNKYNVADSTSTFQYYNSRSWGLEPANQWDKYQRGYKAYRFAFENDKDTVSIYNVNGVDVAGYRLQLPAIAPNNITRRVMIGNPLMCHIDFDKIYALNSDVIEDYYMITEGASEAFQNYRVAGVANELPNRIAPLQGFIVTLKASSSSQSLLLPFEGSSSVITAATDGRSLPKPRSSGGSKNSGWLNITASTPPKTGENATSDDNISTRSTLLINYNMSNIPKVIFAAGLDHKAEVYLIGDDGYLNTEQVEANSPEVVKFGLESTFSGNISLQFKKDENGIIDKVVLVDKYLNTTKDVTDDAVYVFKHRNKYNNGIDNDRFELRLTYNTSSISNNADAPVVVQANRNKFTVESTDYLRTVDLFNAVGKCVVSKADLNATTFSEDISLSPGVYVASVTLVNNDRVVTQKIIVR